MNFAKLQAALIALGLFIAAYAPAFLAVALIRPPVEGAVPLIIAISLAIALAAIVLLARRDGGMSAFGFSLPRFRYVGLAILIGLPLAATAGALSHAFPSRGPIDTSTLRPWMLWLYFGLGASIQEEVIFRGLIQSFLEQRWAPAVPLSRTSVSAAVVFTAILFGAVHLDSGIVVAAAAVVLGLVAGELRRRSGSLLPAMIVHALFNAPSLLWP